MTDARKKILIIESGPGVGGSAFSMYRILKYLDKTRYEPYAFVYYKAPVFSEIESLGIPLTTLPVLSPFPPKLPGAVSFLKRCRNYLSVYGNLFVEILFNGLRLARHIRRLRIDIVHCNNGVFENFAAVFAARITGTPCISHIRGTEPLLKLERRLHRWMRRIIVLNQEMFDLYRNSFGEEKVHLIYNGVDLDLFDNLNTEGVRRELAISPDTFCVGTFARLVEGKGIPEFLEVASKVSNGRNDVRFFVVGGASSLDDGLQSLMKRYAADEHLRDRITFTGWRDDAFDVMSAMDLVLQISTTFPEGMSLAPIEAMAVGKPVIVSDNPGYANIVVDGETGFIVPVGDIETLIRRTQQIADDRELASRLGANARQRVLDEFDYRIVVRRVQNVYEEIA